ncbi:hypothetical protein BH10ACI3_BH10ACI3_16800 [soil metagenome]
MAVARLWLFSELNTEYIYSPSSAFIYAISIENSGSDICVPKKGGNIKDILAGVLELDFLARRDFLVTAPITAETRHEPEYLFALEDEAKVIMSLSASGFQAALDNWTAASILTIKKTAEREIRGL